MLTWCHTCPIPTHLPLFIGRLPSLPLAGFFLGLFLTVLGGSWLVVEEEPPAGAWTWAESIRYTRIKGGLSVSLTMSGGFRAGFVPTVSCSVVGGTGLSTVGALPQTPSWLASSLEITSGPARAAE